jgi:molybdopterin/thiamine biosynthesis adenylyltransferase
MTSSDRERYSRQILFHGIGEQGQERLLQGHAAVIGCGALGTFHAAALARAGVGRITIIDRDYVEPSNLQRQWLFDEADAAAALPKAAAAERALRRTNGAIEVRGIIADLTAANVADLLAGAGVLLDGTDNFATRYLINDYAVSRGVPWVYGAAVGSYGITMPVLPGRTACLRCVYPDPPAGTQATCETAGVLSVAVSAIASLQVADALKVLSQQAERIQPRITTMDIWEGGIRQVAMPARDPECPTCARREFAYLEGAGSGPVTLCGRNAVQVHERPREVDLLALKASLEPLGEVSGGEFALRFRVAPYELTIFADGRAIVKGTDDPSLARSLYARYIGV